MENYIVRIYRRDEAQPDRITGLVEGVESGEIQPFSTVTELATLLAGTAAITGNAAIDNLCCVST
jgi:hypothetical protein